MVRQTIAHSLSHDRKLQIVFEAENGKVLIENLARYKPDVIILDIEMPVMNGFEVLDHLRTHYPEGRVVVLSMHFDNLVIRDLINRGARGLLPKNADFESLLSAIYEVMATGYFFSKKVNPHLVHELLEQKVILPTFQSGNLELHEAELIEHICRDKLNREIAELMNVSERTVERYKSRLYRKAGVKTSGGLVVYAMKNNYFTPENEKSHDSP
jgi:DNA-binding NarL/FixJ family response regulator